MAPEIMFSTVGLARARSAHQANDLTLPDSEIDAVDGISKSRITTTPLTRTAQVAATLNGPIRQGSIRGLVFA